MFKKLTITLLTLFSMVSIAVAGVPFYEYVTMPEEGTIRLDLLAAPSSEWDHWSLYLYDFTVEEDEGIIINGPVMNVFNSRNSQSDTIHFTIEDGVIFNTEEDSYLEMSSSNLGMLFDSETGNGDTPWYSHSSLNIEGTTHFIIFENDIPENNVFGDMTVAGWFDSNEDLVGMVNIEFINNVPLPGSILMLFSGVFSLLFFRKKGGVN